jgi:hypothetical protein
MRFLEQRLAGIRQRPRTEELLYLRQFSQCSSQIRIYLQPLLESHELVLRNPTVSPGIEDL